MLTNEQIKWLLAHPDLGTLLARLQALEDEGKLANEDKRQLVKIYLANIDLEKR